MDIAPLFAHTYAVRLQLCGKMCTVRMHAYEHTVRMHADYTVHAGLHVFNRRKHCIHNVQLGPPMIRACVHPSPPAPQVHQLHRLTPPSSSRTHLSGSALITLNRRRPLVRSSRLDIVVSSLKMDRRSPPSPSMAMRGAADIPHSFEEDTVQLAVVRLFLQITSLKTTVPNALLLTPVFLSCRYFYGLE